MIMFPLIPLPIKEAIMDVKAQSYIIVKSLFPLIPLPIKEAMSTERIEPDPTVIMFPLIPLPIKEAILQASGLSETDYQ